MLARTKEYRPRRVRSEDERSTGNSQYITLTEDGEKFLGYALFEGDPAEDEPGYYEYLEHWDVASRRSIPCPGPDDCPFCEDGDKPKDRAKSLWLVTKDEKGNVFDPAELRIYNLNSILIKQVTEMRSEGDKVKGRLFRVTRTDDRGNYVLMPKTEALKASEVKEALKDDGVPDFDKMVTATLRKAMDGLSVRRALDDDDDDDEPRAKKTKTKTSKGKASKNSAEPDTTDEWPADLDEETVTVKKADKSGDWIEVEHDDYEGSVKVWTTDDIEFDLTNLGKGDEVTVTATGPDEDGDYILSDEPTTEEPEEPEEEKEEGDLPDLIEDETFEVVEVDAAESTIEVKSDDLDLEFTLYFLDTGDAAKVDFDDYEPDMKIIVSAEKDSQGDMVATAIPEVVKAKAKKAAGKKTTAAKKGGKKTAKGGKGKK